MGRARHKDFTAVQRVSADVGFDDALSILLRDGVLIIEGAASDQALQEIEREIAPWFARAYCGDGPFFGRKTRRFGGLFAKAPSVGTLALHPLTLKLMEAVLRGSDPAAPACDQIEINLTQAIGIEPGEPAQFLHRDDELWPVAKTQELMINAMWALDDFTEENGATRVVPGSHRWPRDREPVPGEARQASAPRGSVIIWLGSLLHAGGANRSKAIRRGVVLSFRLAWLAPAEKLLLSVPQDVARRLPQRLQKLIGYQLHKPNLGWVEGRDPLGWLMGEFGELGPVQDNLTSEHEALLSAAVRDPQQFAGYVS